MKKTSVIMASILLAACASSPKSDSSQLSKSNTPTTANTNATAGTNTNSATLSTEGVEQSKLANELQALQKQSVYFDFDKYDIKPEYQDVLLRQAAFLKAHKNDIVTLDGNADERGSEEYNLALGEKRAIAVQKRLKLLGVPKAQIKIVSFGKDKPRLTCHEEKCWKEDRRDDFVHMLN